MNPQKACQRFGLSLESSDPVPGVSGHGVEARGSVLHHTAIPSDDPYRTHLKAARKGRRDLSGPLYHFMVGPQSGRIDLITEGRANHAGKGSWPASVAQGANVRVGNRHTYGICLALDGVGEVSTERGVRSVVVLQAVLALAGGFSPKAIIGHSEWTDRKIDPAGPIKADGALAPTNWQDLDTLRSLCEKAAGLLENGWTGDQLVARRFEDWVAEPRRAESQTKSESKAPSTTPAEHPGTSFVADLPAPAGGAWVLCENGDILSFGGAPRMTSVGSLMGDGALAVTMEVLSQGELLITDSLGLKHVARPATE